MLALGRRGKFFSVNKKGESNDAISWMNCAEDTQLLFSKLRELLILEVKRSSSPVSSTPAVAEPAHKRQKIQQHDLKSIFDDDDVDDDDEENPTQATAVDSISAPAERLFSAAGHTLSSDMSRLTPDIAEAILFTRGVWDLSR